MRYLDAKEVKRHGLLWCLKADLVGVNRMLRFETDARKVSVLHRHREEILRRLEPVVADRERRDAVLWAETNAERLRRMGLGVVARRLVERA